MALFWKPSFYTLQIRCKMWSNPQIFKTSSRFLEYRRFEARRAVFCSIPAYKESKHAETLFTCRALYAFYSWCKISASEAQICAERKISIVWVKSRGIFTLRFHSFPPFSLFLSHFLDLKIYWAAFRWGKFMGLEGRICRWHVRVNVTYFLSFGNLFHRF